ncbi:hypothetical protein [Neisseria subflava]|uniref:hypothetical protein n=1 Tax=Neisseria subflava TaxID=28449 RepID=UPI003D6FFB06|nr:hypothetical protein [Neisseria subflava]
MAPGYYDANSTDAVNGSQLYAVGQSAGKRTLKQLKRRKQRRRQMIKRLQHKHAQMQRIA